MLRRVVSLAELVLLQSEIQKTIYDVSIDQLLFDWLTTTQAKWAHWVMGVIKDQGATGNAVVETFVAVHWQW